MYEQWPFFRALLDNAEMSLLKARHGHRGPVRAIWCRIAALARRRSSIGFAPNTIGRSRRSCASRITPNLMDSDPIIQRSIHLRNPYVDPLNYIQVEMLRRLRALPDQEGEEAKRCAK